jgi:hypothetical protein
VRNTCGGTADLMGRRAAAADILTPVTTMFTWQGADGRAMESARVLLNGGGLRALGRSVRAVPGEPAFTASYRLVVNDEGVVSRLAVTTATAERERTLTLNRTEDGYWMLDTGTGGGRQEFDGALDVDLAYSPLFNALPIRRLGLQLEAGDHELPIVVVSLPTLEVHAHAQRYRTVTPLDDGGRAVVNFSSGTLNSGMFSSDLVVDADGIVVEYPRLATRL